MTAAERESFLAYYVKFFGMAYCLTYLVFRGHLAAGENTIPALDLFHSAGRRGLDPTALKSWMALTQ